MIKLKSILLILPLSLLVGCEAGDYLSSTIDYGLSFIPGTQQQKQKEYYESMPGGIQPHPDLMRTRNCTNTVWSQEARSSMCRGL